MPIPNHRMNSGPSAIRGMLLNAVRKGERIRLSQSLRSNTTAEAMPSTAEATKAIMISSRVVARFGISSPPLSKSHKDCAMLAGVEMNARSARPTATAPCQTASSSTRNNTRATAIGTERRPDRRAAVPRSASARARSFMPCSPSVPPRSGDTDRGSAHPPGVPRPIAAAEDRRGFLRPSQSRAST